MRVVRCDRAGPPEVLEVVEVPDPVAGPDQVVITVALAAVAFVETQARAGRSPRQGDSTFPRVLGNCVGGHVTAIGTGVDRRWLGRAVVAATGGTGGYAEQVAVAVRELHTLPDGLSIRDATALMSDGRTALALTRAAAMRPTDRVLITAAGDGVGSLLVQFARRAGCALVIALAGSDRKLALARDLGADVTIDYRRDGWAAGLRVLINGSNVDVAFDGVGGAVTSEIIGLMAYHGRYLPHGMSSGSPGSIDEETMRARDLTVVSVIIEGPEDLYALVERVFAEAAAGRLKPTIGQTFPLAHAALAHAAIEARATIGKTLLIP